MIGVRCAAWKGSSEVMKAPAHVRRSCRGAGFQPAGWRRAGNPSPRSLACWLQRLLIGGFTGWKACAISEQHRLESLCYRWA